MDWAARPPSPRRGNAILARLTRRQHLVTSIVLVAGADGKAAGVSNAVSVPDLRPVRPLPISKALKAGSVGTYIGEPIVGRVTGNRVMIVARARLTPDGRFDGAITVAISLDRFSEFYSSIIGRRGDSAHPWHGPTARCWCVSLRPRARGTELSPSSGFMQAIRSGASTIRAMSRKWTGSNASTLIVPVGSYPVYVSYGLSLTEFAARVAAQPADLRCLCGGRGRRLCSPSVCWRCGACATSSGWSSNGRARSRAGSLPRETLRQSQKMEALGQLTGGVAHDFNNLLTVIRGNVELLKRKVQRGPAPTGRFRPSSTPRRTAKALTRKLLTFSRRRLVQSRSIELGPVSWRSLSTCFKPVIDRTGSN